MEPLKYMITLLSIHTCYSQKFYYKQDGTAYDVYYGPNAIMGYQQMMAPKSFKPFFDQRMVRPGKCQNANFNCNGLYPYSYTKNFECQYDYQCPSCFKCCQPKCFGHKVCQPAIMDAEHTTITTEQQTSTTLETSTRAVVTTTEFFPTTTETTTTFSKITDITTTPIPTTITPTTTEKLTTLTSEFTTSFKTTENLSTTSPITTRETTTEQPVTTSIFSTTTPSPSSITPEPSTTSLPTTIEKQFTQSTTTELTTTEKQTTRLSTSEPTTTNLPTFVTTPESTTTTSVPTTLFEETTSSTTSESFKPTSALPSTTVTELSPTLAVINLGTSMSPQETTETTTSTYKLTSSSQPETTITTATPSTITTESVSFEKAKNITSVIEENNFTPLAELNSSLKESTTKKITEEITIPTTVEKPVGNITTTAEIISTTRSTKEVQSMSQRTTDMEETTVSLATTSSPPIEHLTTAATVMTTPQNDSSATKLSDTNFTVTSEQTTILPRDFDESKKMSTSLPASSTHGRNRIKIPLPTETDDEDLVSGSGSGDGTGTDSSSPISTIQTDDEDLVEGSGSGNGAQEVTKSLPDEPIARKIVNETDDEDLFDGSGSGAETVDFPTSNPTKKPVIYESDSDDFDIDDSGEAKRKEPAETNNSNVDKKMDNNRKTQVNETNKMSGIEKETIIRNNLSDDSKEAESTTKLTKDGVGETKTGAPDEYNKEATHDMTSKTKEGSNDYQELQLVMSTSIPYNVGTTLDRNLIIPSKDTGPKRIPKRKKFTINETFKPIEYTSTEMSVETDKKVNNVPRYISEENKKDSQERSQEVGYKEKDYFDKEEDDDNDEEDSFVVSSGSGDYINPPTN